jgi:hypothetical protein
MATGINGGASSGMTINQIAYRSKTCKYYHKDQRQKKLHFVLKLTQMAQFHKKSNPNNQLDLAV